MIHPMNDPLLGYCVVMKGDEDEIARWLREEEILFNGPYPRYPSQVVVYIKNYEKALAVTLRWGDM